MQKSDQPINLTLATIAVIVSAANAATSLSPETMEGLRSWLSDQMTSAIRRGRTKLLTSKEVERLEYTYREFRDAINKLQDRTLPPPPIPVGENGLTAWENWQEIYEQFGYNRGASPGRDWLLVGALLALYESLSGERAIASADRNPTMQFLDAALSELVQHAPPELHMKLDWPNGETLKKQMPGLRRLAIYAAGRQLAKILPEAGEQLPSK